MSDAQQLVLPVQLPDQAVFASYYVGANEIVVDHLKSLARAADERLIWVWGAAACGKTHLLQATCAEASQNGRHPVYVPLTKKLQPEILDGLEAFSPVCLDDVGQVAGDPDWESALFNLFNRLADSGGALLISSDRSSAAQQFRLPDLASRMSWGPVYRVEPVGDDELPMAMAQRAKHRGLQLPDETSRFLLRRFPRDMRTIYHLLDTLDLASLRAQRRLTVPFVREVLSDWVGNA